MKMLCLNLDFEDRLKACASCTARCIDRRTAYTNPNLPLVLIPKQLWIEQRREKLSRAIKEYSKAGMVIPIEWIEEWMQGEKDE